MRRYVVILGLALASLGCDEGDERRTEAPTSVDLTGPEAPCSTLILIFGTPTTVEPGQTFTNGNTTVTVQPDCSTVVTTTNEPDQPAATPS
jgi:hypothetical protein